MYQKNTAGQTIGFALVVASTGAALTGATATVYRVLDGGAQAAATGTVTEKGNGQYSFAFSQADTNANLGSFLFTAATAVPVEKTVVFTVMNPTVVDFGLNAATVPASPTSGTWGSALSFSDAGVGRRGTAQGGTSSTITLDSGAAALDNAYAGHFLKITGGTGSGQYATIVSYVGSTKVATITRPGVTTWTTTPDNTSTFLIEPVPQIVLQPGWYTAPDNADVITALADVAAIQTSVGSGLGTLVTAVKTVTDKLGVMITGGGPYSFSAFAMANAPTPDPWATVIPGSYSGSQAGNVLGVKSGYLLAAAGLDAIPVESGLNARQALSPILAAAAGVVLGAGTDTVTIKAGSTAGGPPTRIVGSVDTNGNRTAVTLTVPA